jgi:GntR family transcriptional regulator/MocR family aminotransferase
MKKYELKPYWRKVLQPLLGLQNDKAATLAKVVTVEIDKGVLTAGQVIPTQREISDYTILSKSTVEAAFKILKENGYIETNGTGGTKVSERDSGAVRAEDSGSHPRICHFDKETIFPNEPIMKELLSDIKRAEVKSSNLTPVQRKAQDNPNLIRQFKSLVNDSLPGGYNENEICYAYTLEKAIDSICRLFLNKKSQFVMLDPAEIKIKKAAGATTELIKVIKNDCKGMSIEGLEQACLEGTVGILYIRSRRIIIEDKKLHRSQIIRILELRRKYGFSIIEDDLYADFYRKRPNVFMDIANDMGEPVFYMRALAMNLTQFYQIIVIGGPENDISAVKNILAVTGEPVNGYMSNVVLNLMISGNLEKNQNKLYKHTIKMNSCARRVLKNSNLFKDEGIDIDEGWFFYLIPKKGIFPPDIYNLLAKKGIYVMDPADYGWLNKKINMIRISIVDFLDDERLITDLEYLINEIKVIMRNNK